MEKIRLLAFIFFLLPSHCYAQQANIWYFGRNAGIDFNKSPAVAITDGQVIQLEGSATISDKNGKLLFYTEGYYVWNKLHKTMPNGRGLLGTSSSTQAALIIPNPNDSNLFYIFGANQTSGSFGYSIADMSKDNGLGDITVLNTLLLQNATEKITAVRHANGKDIWVIAHSWNSNEYYSWLVTESGVSVNAIVSAVGSYHGIDINNARGYLKASPDGSELAAAVMTPDNFVELFDFDNKTGIISNPKKITGFTGEGVYGVEFSPNHKFLYLSEYESDTYNYPPANLYQVPLPISSGNISNQGLVLAKGYGFGALQNGPDGKIYHAQRDSLSLNVINNPNVNGQGCNYKAQSFYLNGMQSQAGLPNFIQSYFKEPFVISSNGSCLSDFTSFNFSSEILKIDSVTWNFGDNSAPNKKVNPIHKFDKSGQYNVTATAYYDNIVHSSTMQVSIIDPPVFYLGKDTTLFYGQKLTLSAGNTQNSYKWNTGETTPTCVVSAPGVYWATTTNQYGCSWADTIVVTYDQIINVGLKKDTSICVGQSITLDVSLPGASYLWSNGKSSSSIAVAQPGLYSVKITNCYKNRIKLDTINVDYYKFDQISTVADTVLCEPMNITLKAFGAKKTEKYNWYDERNNFLEQNTGAYRSGLLTQNTAFYVSLTNGLCVSPAQKINVRFNKPIAVINNKDTIIDIGKSVSLSSKGGKIYHWSPSTYLTNPNISNPISRPMDDITYLLTVSNENGCTDTASVKVLIRKSITVSNVFTPNGDGANDLWVIRNIERYKKNEVKVYDRYGALVNDKKFYSNDWDGTYNGKPLPIGTYYYTIYLDNIHTLQTGSVTIVR